MIKCRPSITHIYSSFKYLFISVVFLHIISLSPIFAQKFTRGVGLYPGDENEDFSPNMIIDTVHYRNLALHRPAYHSSSRDYNLTAQLVTDGIIDSELPGWVSSSSSQHGLITKNEQQWIIDRHGMTGVMLDSSKCWIQIELCGSSHVPDVDSIGVNGSLLVNDLELKDWEIGVNGSHDGKPWETLGQITGKDLPGEQRTIKIELEHEDTRGEKPLVIVEGFNMEQDQTLIPETEIFLMPYKNKEGTGAALELKYSFLLFFIPNISPIEGDLEGLFYAH